MNTTDTKIINIDINTFEGEIPQGYELVEYPKGTDPLTDGLVLFGFDEVGTLFKNPQHCFVKIS